MADLLEAFELIARTAAGFVSQRTPVGPALHPFEERNLHPKLPAKVKKLFDDGYFAEATFEAFKFVDKTVSKLAKVQESGFKLMMRAFNETNPLIKLTPLSDTSEVDEQKGYSHLFAGSALAIRNPRGHDVDTYDAPDKCLDHLALASLLLRRLEQARFDC